MFWMMVRAVILPWNALQKRHEIGTTSTWLLLKIFGEYWKTDESAYVKRTGRWSYTVLGLQNHNLGGRIMFNMSIDMSIGNPL